MKASAAVDNRQRHCHARKRMKTSTHREAVCWELWRLALHLRLCQTCSLLPEDLRGVIQFIGADLDDRKAFHIELDGAQSRSLPGVAAHANTWVTTSNAALEALITAPDAEVLFEVAGDRRLFEGWLRIITVAPAACSWLALRAGA